MEHVRSRLLEALVVFFLCGSVSFSSCGLESDTEEDELVIQPLSVTLDAAEISDAVFTVSGGGGLYAWSLSDDDLGSLVSGDSTAIYTNKAVAGQNTVSATDGVNTVSATVIQQ
jgi:hypothetical protein